MPPVQLPLNQTPHRNQQLFSDYYLDHVLPERDDWRRLAVESAMTLSHIQALYLKFTPSDNEAQLEREWVRPILDLLGHVYEVQPTLRTSDGTKRPDYVLYHDDTMRLANRGAVLTDDMLRGSGIAVADAKAWDRSLDVRMSGNADPFNNRNPSYQIAFYIQHSGITWGILTNGRLWRLYHRDTAHKLDRFYEIDLPALIDQNDPTAFQYFYGFFCRTAFDSGSLSLNKLLEASTAAAQGVSDRIKEQVYDALKHVAQGFLDYPANNLHPDPTTLKTIYDNSLIVLYRMLFILYAEARELLPIRSNSMYRDQYSLESLKYSIARDLDMDRSWLSTGTRTWAQLRQLFEIINLGSPPLNVATFNGGLFDPVRHPFLEQHSVGDARLQQAIDLLARVINTQTGRREYVDYRDLAERHLGTIYEGLLEYHLVPLEQSGGFSIDLLNDKGERKGSGSYYTPDYIVKYIVDHTVGPVLQRAVANATSDAAKLQAVLNINVLDPAMGSGHFLVEATEYIARFLIGLDAQPDEQTVEADIAFWRRRVVQACIYGVDLNPLAVDLAKLSLWLITVARDRPLSFLDHHLRVGNALVGARLADLQVGSDGAGAQRRTTQRKSSNPAQMTLLDEESLRQNMSSAVASMRSIEQRAGDTVADIKEQERLYADLRTTLNRRYGRLADVLTATYFGLEIDVTLWRPLAEYATGRSAGALPRFEQWLSQGATYSTEQRFFHWELEFPEVFFDRDGIKRGDAAGFDAVVGNPPWGAEISQHTYLYLKDVFSNLHQRLPDTAKYFFGQIHNIVNKPGYIGQIVPNAILFAHEYTNFRNILFSEYKVMYTINLGDNIFNDVTIPTCIFVAQRDKPNSNDIINIADLRKSPRDSFILENIDFSKITNESIMNIPSFTITDDVFGLTLLAKLYKISEKIGDFASEISLGVHTGCNEAYLITSDQAIKHNIEKDVTWRILTGSDIGRYIVSSNPPFFILYVGWDFNASIHPNTIIYLSEYKYKLENRREAKQGKMPWFSLHWPRSINLYNSPKIICRQTADRIIASVDTNGYCALNSTIIIRPDDEKWSPFFWVAILNSKLISCIYNLLAQEESRIFAEVKPINLRKLPMRRIMFDTPNDERIWLVTQGIRLIEGGDPTTVIQFIATLLSSQLEHTDVLHDLLAHLAQKMINLNLQRQDVLEDLLLDLEGVLPSGALNKISRLWTPSPSTKPDDDAVLMLGALVNKRLQLDSDVGTLNEEQWKWLIRKRVTKLDSLSDVVRVFRRRQPAIAEYDRNIASTDRLIDQIVYRLYGLTDAEIAVVEERE